MAPKVYHVHPLVAGPIDAWARHFARCRSMGFDFVASAPLFAPGSDGDIYLTADHERLHPAFGWAGSADAGIARLAGDCARHDMGLILDLVADRVAADSQLRSREPGWFEPDVPSADPPDPRVRPHPHNVAEARFECLIVERENFNGFFAGGFAVDRAEMITGAACCRQNEDGK